MDETLLKCKSDNIRGKQMVLYSWEYLILEDFASIYSSLSFDFVRRIEEDFIFRDLHPACVGLAGINSRGAWAFQQGVLGMCTTDLYCAGRKPAHSGTIAIWPSAAR